MVDKVVPIHRHLAGALSQNEPGGQAVPGRDREPDATAAAALAVGTDDGLRPQDVVLGRVLVEGGRLDAADLRRVTAMCRGLGDERTLPEMLVHLGLVPEVEVARALADATQLPLADAGQYLEDEADRPTVTARFLKERGVAPLIGGGERMRIAMADPGDHFAIKAIGLACGRPVDRAVGVPSDIERAIERLFRDCDAETAGEAGLADDGAEPDVEQLKDMASEAPVIRVVNVLFQRANEAGASDIHIEPFEDRLTVRCRVDGVLQEIDVLAPSLAAAVVSRIKIMAKLDIAERRLPQDGRIKLRLLGRDLDVRVSTVPTMHGESVVMRLLNRGAVSLDLDSLGFSSGARERFRSALAAPNGMILVTGPTGSGKTTTLYTALNILNTQERKIITAEDPVEYQIEGINQIQVRPAINLTFANVLRSIVRQDPDVILVGEMRDLETARICIQSALTGHLVLSTLHTNSAASTVTRLLEMGVEDYLLNSTLNVVVSQRLVRVLCGDCRQAYRPSAGLLAELAIEARDDARPTLHRAVGCERCNGTGYRGRTVIQEQLLVNDRIRECIGEHADAQVIAGVAAAEGMRTIWQDGCVKALAGVTSIEEVTRVIQDA